MLRLYGVRFPLRHRLSNDENIAINFHHKRKVLARKIDKLNAVISTCFEQTISRVTTTRFRKKTNELEDQYFI